MKMSRGRWLKVGSRGEDREQQGQGADNIFVECEEICLPWMDRERSQAATSIIKMTNRGSKVSYKQLC